jgi:tungstate transport system substrate-binding protein
MTRLHNGLSLALVGILAACAPSTGTVHVGVATSVMDHGGVPALIRTIAEQGGAVADLVPLQPAQALQLLAAGDLDAALVESRTDAEAYVARHPQSRILPLWRLNLVLVGPAADPAAVRGLPLTDAFRRIAETGSPFVSWADRSGVHRREQELWVALGHPRRTGWYREAGHGHRQALSLARQHQAYLLTDAATAAVAGSQLGALTVLGHGDAAEALDVDLVLGDGRRAQPIWRTLADALPAGVAALPEGYVPVRTPAAPAASGRSR